MVGRSLAAHRATGCDLLTRKSRDGQYPGRAARWREIRASGLLCSRERRWQAWREGFHERVRSDFRNGAAIVADAKHPRERPRPAAMADLASAPGTRCHGAVTSLQWTVQNTGAISENNPANKKPAACQVNDVRSELAAKALKFMAGKPEFRVCKAALEVQCSNMNNVFSRFRKLSKTGHEAISA